MTSHIQAISRQFSKFGPSVRFSLDQQTLRTLLVLLSHSLQATGHRPGTFSRVDGGAEPDSPEENVRKASSAITSCQLQEALSAQQVVQLVTDVLEAAADLMLVRDIIALLLNSCPDLHSSVFLSISRSSSGFTRFKSTESTATSLSYTAHARTKPPRPSAVTRPPSTCRTPSSRLCSLVTGEKPRVGPASPACSPCWLSSAAALSPGLAITPG